ncbi:MAG: hypothetical protein ACOH1Q_04500 [Thiobacillus sp.]
MGHNDNLDKDRPELPSDAGDATVSKFEPNDEWLRSAQSSLQVEAMRRWFYSHYEDPAIQTPYISSEGGYIFVWGGPYDPNDVIQDRFGSVVEYKVMEELIHDLWDEVGDEWASVDHEVDEYDDALSMLIVDRTDPYRMLTDRLTQIKEVLTVTGTPQAIQLTTQLAHGAAITALESYLWDTVGYWVANDSETLRSFVATNKDFQAQNLKLANIFERLDGIKAEVETYLRDLVWHRLDKVKPMVEHAIKINFPEINDLMREVLVRHDIVHRGSRNKDGESVTVTATEVGDLVTSVGAFALAIEGELERRFPLPFVEF